MHLSRPLLVALVAVALPAAAEEQAGAGEPAGIEPELVRPLVPIAGGRNDSNPVWSPVGDMLAFERSRGDSREIVIVRFNGEIVQTIYHQSSAVQGQRQFFFPGVVEPTSYNSGISWAPDGTRFVFMSNGGEGNYDLYLREPDGRITRITSDKEKDGHGHWSPAHDRIAFISGRSGKGDVYSLDLATKTTTRLTLGDQPYLYPQWSPDVEHGPAWVPDNRRIAYVRDERRAYNPIYIGDVDSRTSTLVRTGTKMNHDVTCSPSGLIAFRAQVDQS